MNDLPEGTRGMDRTELENCKLCGRGVMHNNDIHFYELTFGQCMVDVRSVQQQHGLEQMMGAAAPLAAVFAPTTRVAVRMPPSRFLVCAPCAMNESTTIMVLFAMMGDDDG